MKIYSGHEMMIPYFILLALVLVVIYFFCKVALKCHRNAKRSEERYFGYFLKAVFKKRLRVMFLYLFTIFLGLVLTALLSGSPLMLCYPVSVIWFPLGMGSFFNFNAEGGFSVFYWATVAFYLLSLLMGIGLKSRKIFYIFLGVFVANIGGCSLFFMRERKEAQEIWVQQVIEYEKYVNERSLDQHLVDAISARGREKYLIRREFGDGQKNALKREEAHMAAQLKAHAEIRALVEQGVNLERPGKYGRTPLMFAIRHADSDMIYPGTVKVLVDLGADLDAQDPRGWTPLHFACVYLKIETIKLLLENGADPTLVTDEGQSPLTFLQGQNADDVAALEEVRALLIEAQKKITNSRQSRVL